MVLTGMNLGDGESTGTGNYRAFVVAHEYIEDMNEAWCLDMGRQKPIET